MKTRILFVEDEPRGVIPYFRELKKKGFTSILAKDEDEAINLLKNKEFDFVTIDIMFLPGKALGDIMPIKSGLRLLKLIRSGKIKNCNPDIKVVVLTARTDPESEKQIKILGVSAYLKKPLEYSKFIETLCELKQKECNGGSKIK